MTLAPTTLRNLARIIDALPDGEDRVTMELVQHWIVDARRFGQRLAILLNAAQPLLDAAAKREMRAGAGNALRQMTHQLRAKAATKAVDDAETVFGDIK